MIVPENSESERRRRFTPSGMPTARLRDHGHVAEIIQDRRAPCPLFICVIQREGSPEILSYSQFSSLRTAKQWAVEELRHLAKRRA